MCASGDAFLHAHVLACACMRACVRACVHTYARAYVRACIRTRVHTYARAYVYTRVLACASTCVRLCTRICACVAEAPSPPATGPGVAAIGANCTSAGDCSAAGAVCERRVCRCPQETPVHDTELNRCLKGVSVNDTCEVSSQCHVMSDLTNCTDGRCMCLYDLIEVQDKNGWHCAVDGTEATRQLGEQCESNSECGVLGGECRNLQCQCHTELPLNNKQDMCGKDANLDEFCRFDEQCTEKMLHTECREHRCRCQQGRVPYPDSHGLIGCMERGKKKMGDPCEDTLQCGFDNALCPEGRKRCQCHPDYPITDGLEKCGQKRTINQSCTFNDECEQGVTKTVCSGGICVCIYGMTAQRSNGGWSCGAPQEAPKQETHLDPAMIGVLVGMALMFIILCVVLRLFSKARWRENRTIFNTPNPRLMNVSLLRDSKLLHSGGERRGSRASVRAPSRQPSMASLRPQSPSQSLGSRAGSRRGSRASSNASGTSTKSPKSPTRPEANNTAAPVLENVTVEVQDPKV